MFFEQSRQHATRKHSVLRRLLAQLKLEVEHLDRRIEEAEGLINKTARESEACRRLDAIPGIGPIAATAMIAAIGNGTAFRKGREFAAWMGVVPREHSTGGKQRLLGITKRGNAYLRRLFVLGARAVLQKCHNQPPGLRAWLAQLTARTHPNVAIVTLANKLARWHGQCLSEGSSITLRCWPIRLPDEGLQMTLG